MATKAASKRLGKESQMMVKDPPPYCFARPREENILEWHFIIRGPPDTPFHGGEYWGQLLFPSEYPFKPPGIKMSTPSGRFHTDSKICTSMSDFHPGSWNPAWSVANILVGLLSFMCADEMTTGSIMTTAADRGTLATRSHAFNIAQPRFRKIFPEYSKEQQVDLPNMGEIKKAAEDSASKSESTASTQAESKVEVDGKVGTKTPAAVRNSSAQASATAIPGNGAVQGQPPDQARSKAFLPLIMALLAYLFLSRVASTMGGVSSNTT